MPELAVGCCDLVASNWVSRLAGADLPPATAPAWRSSVCPFVPRTDAVWPTKPAPAATSGAVSGSVGSFAVSETGASPATVGAIGCADIGRRGEMESVVAEACSDDAVEADSALAFLAEWAERVPPVDSPERVCTVLSCVSPAAACASISGDFFKTDAPERKPAALMVALATAVLFSCTFPRPLIRAVPVVGGKLGTGAVPAVALCASPLPARVVFPSVACALSPSSPEPSESSSCCQLERKLAALDDTSVGAAPTPCALAGARLWADPPVPISIPAATVMRRIGADRVPNERLPGLEHCHDWDRRSRYGMPFLDSADSLSSSDCGALSRVSFSASV